jgi:hypothetical protein
MSSACSRCGTQLPGELVLASWSGRGEKGGGGCGGGGNEYLGRALEQRGWGFETCQMMAGRRAGGISHEALTRGVYVLWWTHRVALDCHYLKSTEMRPL